MIDRQGGQALPAALARAAAALALAAAGAALGDEPATPPPGAASAVPAQAPQAQRWPWRLELKHRMTNRGSAEESTRTTVRVEKLLAGWVALLRADVPYVDKNNAFVSDPTNAGLGDVKCRVALRPVGGSTTRFTPYVDLVFPTASATALGAGKYEVAPGIAAAVPLPPPWSRPGRQLRFEPRLQQYVSVAGDPDRKDVDYTSIELKVEAAWPNGLLLSLNPKPTIDWAADGDTAAVVEAEGAWVVSRAWRLWLKTGTRLWGPKLPGTYDQLLELGVRLTL